MESEKHFASTSSSTSSREERSGGAPDRLVKTEIEAAETLADLARLAMREAASDSGEKLCKKGKQVKRRLVRESPTDDSALNALGSASKCPDLSRDQAVESQQPHQQPSASETKKIQRDVCSRQVKIEQDANSPKTNTVCTSYSLVGTKSRRNLTEEEKEARRIRRVLANRESARQTIRRRQALCEELTRKATNLAQENENLKREKELALKEYQSLENTNKHLKAQIAKSESTTIAKKTPVEHDLPVSETTSSSTSNGPWFLCSHLPVTQLFWPPVIQSSNPGQFQNTSYSSTPIPSNISLPFSSETDLCNKQANLVQDSEIQNPLYLFPCPWLFPPLESEHGQSPPSLGLKDKQDGYPVSRACNISSSPNTMATKDKEVTLHFKIKTEARPIDDPNCTSPKFSINGNEQRRGCQIMEGYQAHSLGCVRHPSAVKEEHGLQLHPTSDTEVSPIASHTANSLLEKKQERVIYSGKNLGDANAAAEARKRRKELTKLKSVHSRQCRLQC